MMVYVYTAAVKAIPNLISNMANPLLDQWSLGGIKNSEMSQAIANAIIAAVTDKIEKKDIHFYDYKSIRVEYFLLVISLQSLCRAVFYSGRQFVR